MSQDVITNQRASEPSNTSASVQPWSADSEADRLMDELFSDIDRILEGGSKLPTEPVKPEYVSLKSLVIPQLTTPPAVMSLSEVTQPPSLDEQTEAAQTEQQETDVATPTVIQTKRWNWSIEKLLLAVGIISLLVGTILLLTNKLKLTWLPNFGESAAQNGVSAADAQFISYMQRSLEVIDRKTAANPKKETLPNPASAANLPPVPTAGNRTLAQNQAPTVLERVYVPVYPAGTPSTPVAPSLARPPLPIAPSLARPSIALPPPVKRPATPSAAPRTVAPSRNSPAPAPPTTAASASPSVQAAAPVSQQTLVGLLELGDRSAALFDINGITQRITVGEAIGSSGWILVSVANQEAVIRRNGEVRSVYVGQKF